VDLLRVSFGTKVKDQKAKICSFAFYFSSARQNKLYLSSEKQKVSFSADFLILSRSRADLYQLPLRLLFQVVTSLANQLVKHG
jgi:hypothetical protein